MAWYLEKVLASILQLIASWVMLSGFFPARFAYCSAVWCSAADTHLVLLDRVVSSASFLTVGVFECDLAHRRSVEVLCMQYMIGSNPMHPLYGALPEPYVPVRVTRGATHRCTYAPPRRRTSQYRRTFIPMSVSLWNDLGDPAFDSVEQAGFKSIVSAFLLAAPLAHFFVSYCFPFLFFHSMLWY